ncbi:MAG: hypothetical protein AB7F86_01815 [Bdellovibrionales bacterium]
MKFFILMLVGVLAHARGGDVQTIADGIYWVPVTPELAQYSAFSIKGIEVKRRGDQIKVEYDLPLELTGAANRIEFSGTPPASGAMTLTSTNGTMICPSSKSLTNCRMGYLNLTFDPAARDELLRQISATEADFVSRQAVATRFQEGGEPHGFFTVLE